jgi:hypothetical protein
LLPLLFVQAAGCEKRLCKVSGEVTFDGEPVQHGDIVFTPDDPNLGSEAGKIHDGKFEFLAKPGKCKVVIQAARGIPGTRDPLNGGERQKDFIPSRYNRKTELRAEVTAKGENQFEFHLSSERR